MSRKSKLRILQELRELRFNSRTPHIDSGISKSAKPKNQSWIRYFAGISSRSLKPVFYYLHHRILTWVLKKYKSFKGSKVKAIAWLRAIEKIIS